MGKGRAKWFLPPWVHRHIKKRERRDAVRQRDGDDCWRCHRPMRFGPPYNVGRAATIEHLLPLSSGGTWALDNLVLCHRGCNQHLGANAPAQKARMRLRRELD